MQKLCCVCTRQHPLPVWSHKSVISSLTHFSTNSHPFSVGIVSIFYIFLSGNLSITKWMKMNLTTDFHLNLMKKEDTGLSLLTTRVITLHERSLLMIPTLSSSDLLSEVPRRHLQTSDLTHQKGRINHKI